LSVERSRATQTSHQPPSILQIIADSVNALIAAPAVLIVPLLVDLLYVGGWAVSIQPAVDRLGGWFSSASFTGSDEISKVTRSVGDVDLTGVFSLVIPTLFGGTDASEAYDPIARNTVSTEHALLAVVLLIVAFFLAALVYGLFGSWLVDAGLERDRTWRERLRALPAVSARIAASYLIGIGIALMISLPMVLAWGATSIAGLDMRGLFLPLIAIAVTAVAVLFYFAPEAVFVAGAKPAEALRLSARVVRSNGWLTLGFIGVTTILGWALVEIWLNLASNVPGLILAMIGSAFTGSVLSLSAMMFFNERWKLLQSDSTPPTKE
jgi:hypothetical protein